MPETWVISRAQENVPWGYKDNTVVILQPKVRSDLFKAHLQPSSKKRKMEPRPVNTTAMNITQMTDDCMAIDIPIPTESIVDPETDNNSLGIQKECPCGYMHGPGQGDHHDTSAVGLGDPLLRGPE
ncbi:hypothetical protein CANTEDRAFT_112323 [Yamadazyma tenuis ATCC 10573]|uniref:Uncharacterized protein n=1 Tax=Candida tenuis (strain ATCC 10573 / BCRC 21748 / CBS 615 / JCM 9827 / NBRC 10315 / NRRL Y-1498 / VKM Y-70) TaxID=590646 RepID=G3AWT3_CANTC|nr:uncharacterized protein CANTEDRAFT_112323 [Yamadazyma tenuis ATCC 10573]EGV66611.1 hypothetical protein CANTEDRAFT_112323 [Yamadazyma tenuis ATCC 10573]